MCSENYCASSGVKNGGSKQDKEFQDEDDENDIDDIDEPGGPRRDNEEFITGEYFITSTYLVLEKLTQKMDPRSEIF